MLSEDDAMSIATSESHCTDDSNSTASGLEILPPLTQTNHSLVAKKRVRGMILNSYSMHMQYR